MECERLKELIDDYLDGILPQTEGEAFERHLAECEGCREEFAFVRMLASDLGETTLEQTPQGYTDKILKRLPSRKFRFVLPWGLSIGEVAITAATLIFAAFLSFLLVKYASFDALYHNLDSFAAAAEKLSVTMTSWNEHILALGQHPEPIIIIGILGLALLYVIWTEEDYGTNANSNNPNSVTRPPCGG